jgi:hypothetical protein
MSVRELSLADRLNAQAARREAMTRRAMGFDTLRMLERLTLPQVYDPVKYTGLMTRSRLDLAAFASQSIVESAALVLRETAFQAYRVPNPALMAMKQMTSANTALTMRSLWLDVAASRAATFTRVLRSRDLFGDLARSFDVLASRQLAATQVATTLSRQQESVLAAHARAFARADLSRSLLDAAVSASTLLEANRRLLENALGVGDGLRIHNLLRRHFAEAGLELTWDDVYGEGLREFVDSVRQADGPVGRERRHLLFGIVYATAEAADAFAEGDVDSGVMHTMAAMILLRWYAHLRLRHYHHRGASPPTILQ